MNLFVRSESVSKAVPDETGPVPPIIEICSLTKIYDETAGPVIDDVSLKITRGTIHGIIGRSGAGKSTLVRCLNGLVRPNSGEVFVSGREITTLRQDELRRVRREVSMIFQHFSLLSSRTAFGNIALPLELAGVDRSTIRTRVNDLLDLVGLKEKADAYPSELSGGQKQRVGIARALALEPSVLLSDEATSALDPETTEQILSLLKDINRRLGLTIVLITHEMDVVRQIADHVTVLDGGKVVESGGPSTSSPFRGPLSPGRFGKYRCPRFAVGSIAAAASGTDCWSDPVLRIIFRRSRARTGCCNVGTALWYQSEHTAWTHRLYCWATFGHHDTRC